MSMFRNLKKEEIECKISTINEKGASILLYKTARTDMQILDETVEPFNWKCDYKEIKGNMYCGISIWDKDKKEWVTKWDCGTESDFGDKEKGEASDSFKRAGFRWLIGIELYTSPFIWIPSDKITMYDTGRKDGKGKTIYATYDKFSVEAIEITNKVITGLAIVNQKGERVFTYRGATK